MMGKNISLSTNFLRRCHINPEDLYTLHSTAERYAWSGNYSEAEHYYRKIQNIVKQEDYQESASTPPYRHRLGYVLWQTGRKEESMNLFLEQMDILKKRAEQELITGYNYYYDIAGINAVLSKKEEAYIWLEKNDDNATFWHAFVQNDPIFDNLRGDERFQRKMIAWKSKIYEMQQKVKMREEEEELKRVMNR